MHALAFFKGNDMLLEVRDLKDVVADTYINSAATVSADIYDVTAAAIVSSSGIALSYVAASNGKWRGTYPYSLALLTTGVYRARITVLAGSLHGYWEADLLVQYQPQA